MRLVKKLENKTLGDPQFKIISWSHKASLLTHHPLNRQTNTSEIQKKVLKGKGERKKWCDQNAKKKPKQKETN